MPGTAAEIPRDRPLGEAVADPGVLLKGPRRGTHLAPAQGRCLGQGRCARGRPRGAAPGRGLEDLSGVLLPGSGQAAPIFPVPRPPLTAKLAPDWSGELHPSHLPAPWDATCPSCPTPEASAADSPACTARFPGRLPESGGPGRRQLALLRPEMLLSTPGSARAPNQSGR